MDLVTELQTVQNARQESDRRRKQAETQLADVQSRIGELERSKSELLERSNKLQAEAESIASQVCFFQLAATF